MMMYAFDYYENGKASGTSCYENYRWLPDTTRPMVGAVMEALGIEPGDTVLDYGCAKGFIVRAFRERGVEAWGLDVSTYALNCAPREARPYVMHTSTRWRGPGYPVRFDWLFCKDVLEHIESCKLTATVKQLARDCQQAFIVVPLADGGTYNAPENELDVTHEIRRPLDWWATLLGEYWHQVEATTTPVAGLKKRFTEPDAHGFFICK